MEQFVAISISQYWLLKFTETLRGLFHISKLKTIAYLGTRLKVKICQKKKKVVEICSAL